MTKKPYVKMNGVSRARLMNLIKEHYPKSSAEITRLAAEKGITTTSGTEIPSRWVTGYTKQMLAAGDIVRADKPATPPPSKLPVALVGILTDPSLDDAQKVRMCLAYAQV